MYSFRTAWVVDAVPERCRELLADTLTGATDPWWPGLAVTEPAARVAPGERLRIEVRVPFGYRLRCALRLTEAGSVVAADSTGDLEGRGRVELARHAQGTVIRFFWDVEARPAWMRVLAPALRPVFELGHRLVMRAGERGLRRALAMTASGIRNPANPAPERGSDRPAG